MNLAEERFARLAQQPLREMNPPDGFLLGTWTSWRKIAERRELLGQLVVREIKSRYKDSILGVAWSFIRPLVQLLVYYLVIGRFLGAARSIPDFAIYVFTGLTIWGLFNEIIIQGTSSILTNAGLIKKVALPREVFPLAAVGSALFNFVFQAILLILGAIAIAGITISPALWLIPVSIAIVAVWATSFALVFSAVNVYLRDVQYIVEVGLMIAFWASPIIYSWAMMKGRIAPWFETAYLHNPITLAIIGFQQAVWGSPVLPDGTLFTYPDRLAGRMGWALLVGIAVLFLAQRAFSRLQRNFAQEL